MMDLIDAQYCRVRLRQCPDRRDPRFFLLSLSHSAHSSSAVVSAVTQCAWRLCTNHGLGGETSQLQSLGLHVFICMESFCASPSNVRGLGTAWWKDPRKTLIWYVARKMHYSGGKRNETNEHHKSHHIALLVKARGWWNALRHVDVMQLSLSPLSVTHSLSLSLSVSLYAVSIVVESLRKAWQQD
jgi:hypothetical protein